MRTMARNLRAQGFRWLREPRWMQLAHDLAVVDCRLAIERATFPHEESLPNSCLTVCVGICEVGPEHDEAQALLHAADMALYQGKHEGRNRVIVYDAPKKEQTLPAIS